MPKANPQSKSNGKAASIVAEECPPIRLRLQHLRSSTRSIGQQRVGASLRRDRGPIWFDAHDDARVPWPLLGVAMLRQHFDMSTQSRGHRTRMHYRTNASQ